MSTKSVKVKRVLIVIGIIAFIAVANYHGYRVGVTTGQEADILILAPAIKKGHECLAKRDMECLQTTNEILITALKAKLVGLKEKGIFVDNIDFIDEYLRWSESVISD